MDNDREYLEITFNTIDEGIAIFDSDLCLIIWNAQFAQMGILQADDLYRGANIVETYVKMARQGVFGDGDPEALAKKHVNALKEGPLIVSELLNATTNRLIRINRFRLKNGGICATFRDITDERRTELQLRQAAKLDAIGKLTGGVAHDLNNVLAVIVGSLEVAQVNPNASAHYIEVAIEAADQGAQLIRGLLAFARQQPLEPTITSVAEPLASLQNILPRLIGETIDLQVIFDAGLWLAEFDVNQFESVVLNLVVNARDAMINGGKLTIEATNTRVDEEYAAMAEIAPGQYVCVSVTDTGSGMSADIMEKAFDPFFTTKGPGVGTGLGLSMAHGFAKQSNGHIKLYSELEVGTTCKLYLPRSFSSPSVPATTKSSIIKFSELSVLVVEDDDALRAAVATQVRSLGCTVMSASTGKEALAMVAFGKLDILLTDVVMPAMGGLELAKAAIHENPKLAIVYMSGYTENSIIHQGKVDPGVVLLQKPFRRADLSAAFEKALRRSNYQIAR